MEALINAFARAVEAGLVWIVLACYVVGAVLALALLEKEIRSAFRYVRRVGVEQIIRTAVTQIVGLKNAFSVRTLIAGMIYLSPIIVLFWATTETNNRVFSWLALATALAGIIPLAMILDRWGKKAAYQTAIGAGRRG